MIKGVHTMFYSAEPQKLRAFLRDVIGFPATDVGDGWLIFSLPEADMGVHPSHDEPYARPNTHNISFYTSDIHKTVAELKAKGVEFTEDVSDQGFGLVTFFKAPGDLVLQLYQPHYVKNC